MKTTQYLRLIKIILTVTILVSVMISTSCSTNSKSNNIEYKKVILTRGDVQFSFECPTSFQDKNGAFSSRVINNGFLLKRIDTINTWMNSDTSLRFSITDAYPNAKAYLDSLILDLNKADPNNQIKIIDNSDIKIASISENLLYYSAVYSQPHFLTYVFFDYKGQVWSLYMDALGNVSDQAKSEFDHIVNSFKYL